MKNEHSRKCVDYYK